MLHTPVVDQTGLRGRYDITVEVLKHMAEHQAFDATADPLSLIITALQEELGLRLESRKLPMEMLAVEHANRSPIEN